ncbi:MAG: hypothetical protein JWM47_3605 [Acidimicrobiales bacterium]|nr:hypothetical protein [Acidimicrobiales bacterium]
MHVIDGPFISSLITTAIGVGAALGLLGIAVLLAGLAIPVVLPPGPRPGPGREPVARGHVTDADR